MQELLHVHQVNIEKSRIQVDPGDIIKLLGQQHGMTDEHTGGLVEEYIAECLRISTPAGAFVITEALASTSPEALQIQDLRFDTGNIIPKMLLNSQKYAFFLVTAGPEPERLVRSLMAAGNYLEGYIVDLTASAVVDSAADQVQDQVRDLAGEGGLSISNRYSPGYCSWNVEEQQKLFKLFPRGCCGISLSNSSLMNPVKSVSGIIGIGEGVKFREYICELCSMRDCHFRRVRDQ